MGGLRYGVGRVLLSMSECMAWRGVGMRRGISLYERKVDRYLPEG